MKRRLVFGLAILIAIALLAHDRDVPIVHAAGESIDRSVIASGGGMSSGGNIMIQDTIGQSVIALASGPGITWSAGYWYQIYRPTAVTLASFVATPQHTSVVVRWITATELDNLGFNLYRATSPTGTRTQLNASLIPSQNLGGITGATYTYTDRNVVAGIKYYYWLELVSVSGTSTLTGPVTGNTLNTLFLPLMVK